MRVAIIGLGLIGGSLAKAFREHTDAAVYGYDRDDKTMTAAIETGVVDAVLPEEGMLDYDILFVALYPRATVTFVEQNAQRISPATLVVDCCGVKTSVCEPCFALAEQYGFTFVGGHPMAGTERAGFAAARADLFDGASMLLAPKDPELRYPALDELFLTLGFGRVVYTTPAEHDDIIAYTSQLAHVVSSAYIQSPTAAKNAGFSAGSFKDLTRVAYLSEDMWSELFLANRDALVREIDTIVDNLQNYRSAINSGDRQRLWNMLHQGKLDKLASERMLEEQE